MFTENIRNVIKKDISDLNKGKENDKAIKSVYLTEANYEIEKIVKSGNTLINDEITKYLNKLMEVVLVSNTDLKSKLNLFTLKSTVVNAYSYDKGFIFFDVGLIAQAETEAQLAYILCHEISHYTKKHNIQGYVKNRKLEKEVYEGKSTDDILIEKCQYSKENESEADLEGFKLFEGSNFNFDQAKKAFDVLQYAHLPFELVEFKKHFLESENMKLPAGYFLKEVSSIRNNASEDDTKSTHPNTAKRKSAIEELIKARDNAGRVNNVLGEEQFSYIRDLARFECCRLYLKNRDYPNALYAAYILREKYPDNKYLAQVISKSLYAITLYKKGDLRYGSDSYMQEGIASYSNVESFPQQIYHLIEKMPENEWAIISLNYAYRAHKKFLLILP
ncbi:MAG: M48 family metallopeptidase [Sphingobacteriaceae bacterium]|nr:M48 family metallopeptidase [Sphingobacteriaceae bacterium]